MQVRKRKLQRTLRGSQNTGEKEEIVSQKTRGEMERKNKELCPRFSNYEAT